MSYMTTAGSVLSLSAGSPATYDAAGFAALSYTAIGEITDLGEFGKEYNLVTHNPIGNRQTKKVKGSYNNGSMQLQMARDPNDAGQLLAITALNSDSAYAFKLTMQDGTINYFQAVVMSYRTSLGGVDQITAASMTIELTADVVEV